MYAEYFGLTEKPFSIAPDPGYLFMSASHREALAHLLYGLQTEGGFVLLTGEVGTGKTTICKSLLNKIPPSIDLAFILNPRITETELLETICDELHIPRPIGTSKKNLVDRLNQHLLETNAKGRKTVLIIDEAQNLAVEVLEQLRLLTNLETDKRKLLQIILLGQPELREMINRPQLRQLAQRITARYHLGPLAKTDIAGYIFHRLQTAGGKEMLFNKQAVKQIHKQSLGIPRLINLLCDRSLLGAYTQQKKLVTAATVKQASREVFDRQSDNRRHIFSVTVLITLFLAAGIAYSLFAPKNHLQVEPSPPSAAAPEPDHPVSAEPPPVAALEPAVPEPTLSKTWPPGFGFTNSAAEAFADLAALWGLSYPTDDTSPCDFALAAGLRCYDRQESIVSLRELNRPAILTLYDDQGTAFYALLVQLDENRGKFMAAKQQRELDIAALETRWFGEYRILWQPPEKYSGIVYPGAQDAVVPWLAQSLVTLGLYPANAQGETLEGQLLGTLKRFQFSVGLTPDGVLGPKTIIHLNRGIESPGPRLFQSEAN